MKNNIYIDATNNCACDLVSNINDGTNRIILDIHVDLSLNPILNISSSSVQITTTDFVYEIPSSMMVTGSTLKFNIVDDSHTGNIFSISIPDELTQNGILRQVDNFKYELSSGKNATAQVDIVYPVGSIYMSVVSTSPATLFGGTWEQLKDRFLLAAGDSYSAGGTGGAATVALVTANLPSHNHSIPALSGTAASAGAHTHTATAQYNKDATITGSAARISGGGSNKTTSPITISSAGAHTHSVTTNASTSGNQGSGTAHNNMPPYLTVYMWKRTA